jgi:hypothetical protein
LPHVGHGLGVCLPSGGAGRYAPGPKRVALTMRCTYVAVAIRVSALRLASILPTSITTPPGVSRLRPKTYSAIFKPPPLNAPDKDAASKEVNDCNALNNACNCDDDEPSYEPKAPPGAAACNAEPRPAKNGFAPY